MDGVLEGASLLSACKLACSLLFLPSVAASRSPVSFCCCSLLVFTDFLLTAFLTFLWALNVWQTELKPSGDVIALRFLLFLSHTYGGVLLLTTFLIALDTLIRVLLPTAFAADRRMVDSDGDEEDDGSESLPDVVRFLCCLSVWIAVAFSVMWHWKLDERWTAACLDTRGSLVTCLPNAFSSMHIGMDPYWSVAFLLLLGLLLSLSIGLQRRNQRPAAFKPVCPERFPLAERDFVLVAHDCLSEKWVRLEHERTQKHVPQDSVRGQGLDSNQVSLSWWQLWGSLSLKENAVIGFISVLFIFTLPFYLSVNILLIRTIDASLQGCTKSLLSYIVNSKPTLASHRVTLV